MAGRRIGSGLPGPARQCLGSEVPGSLMFGAKVAIVDRIGRDVDCDSLDDIDAGRLERP